MALTRPTFQNLNTNNAAFNDSLTVTNFANVANRDIGQIFDRSQSGKSNVAIIWSEALSSIRLGYTSDSGSSNANVNITSNADIVLGNLTTSGFANVGTNLRVLSTTDSLSTASGALIVAGGAGFAGNVFASNLYATNFYYANGAAFSSAITLDGDVIARGQTGSNTTVNLTTTGVTAGTFGNATSIPTIAVDSKGRITSISANSVSTTINLAGGSGSGNVSGGGTLTLSGTTNQINTSVSGSTVTFSLPTSITTPGDVVITGNLTVNGNTTTINANTITTNDKNITVANNQSTSAGIDGAGIDAGSNAIATWRFNNATTSWQSNIGLTPTANATLSVGGTGNYWGTGYFNAIQAPSITGILQTAAQTNITSLGTLTGLTLSGTLNGTTLQAATIGNSGATLTGTLSTAAQPNVTSLGTLTGLTLSGTLTGTSINAATIGNTGSALTGTLQTAAQTNITSVGTLTGLTLSGTLNGTTLQAATFGNSGAVFTGATYTASSSFNGPLNGTLGSAGGNTAIVSTLSATSNATVNALTVNNSVTIGSTLGVTGNITAGNITIGNLVVTSGIQNTPIGNAIASTGAFTSLSATGTFTGTTINAATIGNTNATLTGTLSTAAQNNITSVGTLTGLTLSGTLNGTTLQAAVFGNTGSSFTGATYTASGTFNGPLNGTLGGAGGNTAIVSTLSTTGNATVSALTVNTSAVITTTLQAAGGLQNTPIGNVNGQASTGSFTTVTTSGNVIASALTVNNSVTIGTTLGITGNVYSTHILPSANLSYDIGSPTARYRTLYLSGNTINLGDLTISGNVVGLAVYGNITGNGVTSNGSITAITTLSALGGLQNTPIGNVAGQASSASFTTITANSNVTASALTVNNSVTIGTTLGITGTTTASAITASGTVQPNANATVALGGTSNYWGSAYINSLNAPSITGVLQTAAQTNITSVGTLTGLTLSGTLSGTTLQAATIGNASAVHTGATYYASGNFYGVLGVAGFANAATVTTLSANGNITASALTVNNSVTVGTTLGVTGNATVGNILANAFYFANGAPFTSVGGTTGQIQYNNAGNPAGATYLTYISGNGQIVANAGISSTNTLTGTMVVSGGVGVSGNINSNGLAVSNSTTIGSTLSVVGNVTLLANITSPTNTNVTLAPAGTGVVSIISGVGGATGIAMGTPTQGNLTSNAVTLTVDSSITNSIAQLNVVLGKLVPTAPNNFPSTYTLTVTTATVGPYRMANTTQTDNTNSGGKTIAAGNTVSVIRGSGYTTSTIANVGPGDSGVLTGYRNGVAVGTVALTGSSNGTYSNLVVLNNQDYHNVVSSVSAGFWYSFSTYMSGVVQPGWNEVNIKHSTTANSAVPYWYYDSTSPGTPTWSNVNIALVSNSSTYSSTIPHLNSSSIFTLTANVARLSGDTFPSSNTFVTGTAGGAIAAPSSVTYAQAVGITYPLAQNLYVSSGSAYLSTNAAVIAGFGSSSTGPSLTADNSYSTAAQAFTTALGKTVLYKTGTASTMEETSITFGSTVGVGSGLAFRIINPGSADTPTYTGTEAAFDSQNSTLQTYDATIVAATLKNDTTNYSTGYLPVGPNLSGQGASQYFTFKFIRTSVSKFDIRWSGTIAGLWVALPGSTIDSASTLNGWLDLSVAYGGSGIPGANTGAGGNGSNGGSLGGTAPLNSAQVNKNVTVTFGTVSSSSTSTNEIYVRIKLTTGQSVTALSLQTASN